MKRKIFYFLVTALLVMAAIGCLQIAHEGYWGITHPDALCKQKCKEVFSEGNYYVGDNGLCVCTDGRPSIPFYNPKNKI